MFTIKLNLHLKSDIFMQTIAHFQVSKLSFPPYAFIYRYPKHGENENYFAKSSFKKHSQGTGS